MTSYTWPQLHTRFWTQSEYHPPEKLYVVCTSASRSSREADGKAADWCKSNVIRKGVLHWKRQWTSQGVEKAERPALLTVLMQIFKFFEDDWSFPNITCIGNIYLSPAKYPCTRLWACFTLFKSFSSLFCQEQPLPHHHHTQKISQIQTEIHSGSQNAIATGQLLWMGCDKIPGIY